MNESLFDLSGRVALVTGASSGLGAHFARVLAANGARVVVAARRQERLRELVEAIQAAGGDATAIAMDVTDADSVDAGFDAAEQAYGTVDLLVNNAGVAQPRSFLKTTEADWDFVMDTNLKAAWRVARAGAERMKRAGRPGSIVNIASLLGLGVQFGESLYATSKAGVVQLTRHMALELMRHGIRVNAICPGYFETEMNRDFFASEQGQAFVRERIPSQRLGELPELSGPLLLLASDAGSFVNGVALPVDGGHLLKSL
ncbi:SDR family NAD(P)-dependent oxidoreductase [Aquisalimonas asiatica]|uniref:NAD(P)-dependent dehydrogenase, short-chain alcohol dehydrogenase family n=1 Tax=Aquisalimonas asiatica TaxID=406100 RepID=A0A1H8UKS0_9GAMM|nr:glucose 1-dehydrogenase [Aquisalimonas asiatica]SEP03617.1 NAD(P)-dependent dehydrogenase, short-chain alcohol dehydrogenase family [Aquisalimonas asiatica]